MIKNISNLGDAALYCDFGIEVNRNINSEVIKYFKAIKEKNIEGINNLTPSYNKLIISFDLSVTNYSEIKDKIEKLNINVSVNVHVMLNGIIDYNNMIFTNQIELSKVDKKILHKITISIVKTLKGCSPLRNLPKDKYGIWKRMNIKFKY